MSASDHINREQHRDAGSTGVCTHCAYNSNQKIHGVGLGTESMVPVEPYQMGGYPEGNCSSCGTSSVLFKINPATGAPLTKSDSRVLSREESMNINPDDWRSPAENTPMPNIPPMTQEKSNKIYGNEKHSLGTFPIPKDRIPKDDLDKD